MALEFGCPDDLTSGGTFLNTPGCYHLICTAFEERAAKKDHSIMNAVRIHATVIDGSVRQNGVCTEYEKDVQITLFDADPTAKNEGEFNRKKQARAFVALGLMRPEDNKPGARLSIDGSKAVNRQFKAHFEFQTDKDGNFKLDTNGNKRLDLAFADIWHIDDPDGAGVPTKESALSVIPKEHRLPKEAFACMKAGGSNAAAASGGNGSAAPSLASSSTPSTAAPSSTNLDDDVAALLLAE